MADKTFKVKPGEEEVVIRLSKKKPAVSRTTPPRRKGIIQTRRPDDFLPRRLKKQSFINIFDASYAKISGTWQNLPIVILRDEITLADYVELINLIESVGYQNLLNTSKIIETFRADFSTDNYFPRLFDGNIGILPDIAGDEFYYEIVDSLYNPPFHQNWTADGLKLTAEELQSETFYIHDYQVKGTGALKLTNVLDYDAPEVAFAPTAKFDVVFIPRLFISRSAAGDGVDDFESAKYRTFNLNAGEPEYDKTSQYFRANFGGSWNRFGGQQSGGVPNYHNVYRALLRRDNLYGLNTASLVADNAIFPVPPGDPYERTTTPYAYYINNESAPDALEHRPVLMIKQAGASVYVWS